MTDSGADPPQFRLQNAIEEHLLTAPIELARDFHLKADPGGGHASKVTLLLEGGTTALAKYAPPGDLNLLTQAKQEVGAWHVLVMLGWPDLGAATVLRRIEVPGQGEVSAAILPVFSPDLWIPAPLPETLDQDQTFRAAIFDFLILNADRSGHNWLGLLADLPPHRLKLYDHGHCFGLHVPQVSSTFVAHHTGQQIPEHHREALKGLSDDRLGQLAPYLDTAAITSIGTRRDELLDCDLLPNVVTAAA